MRALITGASGFVGSALARALLGQGHEVVAYSRSVEAARKRIGDEARFVAGGVGDPNDIAKAARGVDVVFHTAGVRPVAAPLKVLRWLHVAGTENVITAARHVGVKRVVHMSCADVTLHEGDRMHWDEKRVLPSSPEGAHAQTKLVAEELALAHSDEQLTVTALRPAFVWGAGDVEGLAALAREARSGGYRLYGGGRNIVATTHIDNIVRAALSAARAEQVAGRSYYITDGEFWEAREFFGRLCAALGLPAPKLDGNVGFALARGKLRALFAGDHGAARCEVLRRSTSALFDLSRATADLDYTPGVELDGALAELAAYVAAEGGLAAIEQAARPLPREEDVAAQIAAAGGDLIR